MARFTEADWNERERQVKALADDLEGLFLTYPCSTCGAEVGEPCLLPDEKYHIDRVPPPPKEN